jgi:hypothetical protein
LIDENGRYRFYLYNMKLSASILALSVLNAGISGASAFTAQAPKARSTTALESSPYSDIMSSTGTGTTFNINPVSRSQYSYTNALKNAMKGDARSGALQLSEKLWESEAAVDVQGGSLRTWSFASASVERVLVALKTEGRPLNTDIDLWHGPDNTPQKMRIYSEDGNLRPVGVIVETPRANNAIAVRNIASMEYPLTAAVEADDKSGSFGRIMEKLDMTATPRIIQGGAVRTFPFSPGVDSVQVMLTTDGRPLNARIELLQGPNNNKQVLEVYTEDGLERPFFIVLETPGVGNVVRIVNTATIEFPLTARVDMYRGEPGAGLEESEERGMGSMRGDSNWWMDRF